MREIERRWRLRREERLWTANLNSTIIGDRFPIVHFLLARTGETSEHTPVGHIHRRKLWFDHRHAWCAKCGAVAPWPCLPIREEATRFADHPDYREEWRPAPIRPRLQRWEVIYDRPPHRSRMWSYLTRAAADRVVRRYGYGDLRTVRYDDPFVQKCGNPPQAINTPTKAVLGTAILCLLAGFGLLAVAVWGDPGAINPAVGFWVASGALLLAWLIGMWT